MKSNFSKAIELFDKAANKDRLEVLFDLSLASVVLSQPIPSVDETIRYFLDHGTEIEKLKVKMITIV